MLVSGEAQLLREPSVLSPTGQVPEAQSRRPWPCPGGTAATEAGRQPRRRDGSHGGRTAAAEAGGESADRFTHSILGEHVARGAVAHALPVGAVGGRSWKGLWRPHPPRGHVVSALSLLRCLNPSLGSESQSERQGNGQRTETLALPAGRAHARGRPPWPSSVSATAAGLPVRKPPIPAMSWLLSGPSPGLTPTPHQERTNTKCLSAHFLWKGLSQACSAAGSGLHR